jgi:nucleotide-binding universal stress UspA family protein
VSILLARAGPPATDESPGEESYERVIIPVDLSRRSDWALSVGVLIARAAAAEIELLHVVSVPELPERVSGDIVGRVHRTRLLEVHREVAREYMVATRDELAAPDVTVRTRLLESSSVLVVSAHGVSGESPWPYGSVASHLIMHGTLPLLVLQDVPREMPLRSEPPGTSGVELPASWNA